MTPAFVITRGPCLVCHQLFDFHPLYVPSVKVCSRCLRPLDQHEGQDHEIQTPTREPVCENCMGLINTRRAARGLPIIQIHERAYEPAAAEEVPWDG